MKNGKNLFTKYLPRGARADARTATIGLRSSCEGFRISSCGVQCCDWALVDGGGRGDFYDLHEVSEARAQAEAGQFSGHSWIRVVLGRLTNSPPPSMQTPIV